jgi:hypothetical protein
LTLRLITQNVLLLHYTGDIAGIGEHRVKIPTVGDSRLWPLTVERFASTPDTSAKSEPVIGSSRQNFAHLAILVVKADNSLDT